MSNDDKTPTPLFADPDVEAEDPSVPPSTVVDPVADAKRVLAEGDDNRQFEGNISVDELVAAYGAAKLTAEKLTQVNARQANEIFRLRATLRNLVKAK